MKFASLINYSEYNVSKQSQKMLNENVNKQSKKTSRLSEHLCSAKVKGSE